MIFLNIPSHWKLCAKGGSQKCYSLLSMAMSSPLWVAPPFLSRPSSNISRSITYKRCRSSASNFFSQSDMEQPLMKGQKLMEFPHLTAAHKDLMVSLISALETRLDSHLLASSVVPPDVEFYQNDQGTSQGSLHIRRGLPSSHVLASSPSRVHIQIHCCLFIFILLVILISLNLDIYIGHCSNPDWNSLREWFGDHYIYIYNYF